MTSQQMNSQAMFAEYIAANARNDDLEEQMQRENQELKATIASLKVDLDSERKFSNFRAKCFLDKEKHSQRVIDNLRTQLGSYLKHLSNAKAAAVHHHRENIHLNLLIERSKANESKVELFKGMNKQLNDCITTRDRKIGELNDYIDLLHNVLERHSIFEEQEKKQPVVECSGYHTFAQQNVEISNDDDDESDHEASPVLEEDQQEYDVEVESTSAVEQEEEEEEENCFYLSQLRHFDHYHTMSPILEEDEEDANSECAEGSPQQVDVVDSDGSSHHGEVDEDIELESSGIVIDNSCDDHAHVNSTSPISQPSSTTNKKLKKRKPKKSKRNYSLIYSIASL